MGKFPHFGKWFVEKKNVLKRFRKKHKTIFSVLFLVSLGFVAFNFSSPTFYALSYGGGVANSESRLVLDESRGTLVFKEDLKGCYAKESSKQDPKDIFVAKENEFEEELYGIVGDYPIKEMVPYIAEKDRKVAAFLVGIAKKESNWGKRVPTLNGQDCYNYWGYKGDGGKGSALGYSCFSSPEEAIDKVGKKLEQLVEKKLDTPGKMVVWKCGSSCEGHDPGGVQKWISDVSVYFNRISGEKV